MNWEKDSEYPRPQLRRDRWTSLDGPWKFTFDETHQYSQPSDIKNWNQKIIVPFAPETPASGIADTGFHHVCWYQREVELKPKANEKNPLQIQGAAKSLTATPHVRTGGLRYHLHFGAVDYLARVWVNGHYQGSHEGGHVPFSFDVTDSLSESGVQTITVQVEDDPFDLAKPRGKQDWQLEPHSIWYPRTTGIWQTVWMEELSSEHIAKIRWEPHLERWEIGCEIFISGRAKQLNQVSVNGNKPEALFLRVRLTAQGQTLANDRYEVIQGEVHRRLALSDPGIDDFRNELLWSPERPTLIEAEITLEREEPQNGARNESVVLDRVYSYTALRSVDTSRDRFTLNGRPYFLRMVLDQGYWPETFLTPPNAAACRRDIELIKAAGFNGARKHQKIESPAYLYWADRLGLIVWEEMPSAYRFTTKSVERLTREWIEVIERDYNHPCICVWVPFNESWGVPDLAMRSAHQNAVRALYHLTKTLDSNRLVVGNDGWESLATDLIGIHDYDHDPKRILERYGGGVNVAEMLTQRRPAGRLLTLDKYPTDGQPVLLTEFGGIAVATAVTQGAGTWGYSVGADNQDLERRYRSLLTAVHLSEVFSGFCYTQFTDTFQEANGLFNADRTPKFPIERMLSATQGRPAPRSNIGIRPSELDL